MTRLFTIHDVDEETLVLYIGLHPMKWRVEYGKPAATFAKVDDPVYDAAPELLEACKAAHNLISYMHIKAYDRASAGEVLGKLNLAIERAEVRND